MCEVLQIEFTVTASTTLTANIYKDRREKWNELVIGFDPYINPLHYEHEVSSMKLRTEARKVAIELASQFSGMPAEKLTTNPEFDGVGSITVFPKKGHYP